jgi:hypothetical protein
MNGILDSRSHIALAIAMSLGYILFMVSCTGPVPRFPAY